MVESSKLGLNSHQLQILDHLARGQSRTNLGDRLEPRISADEVTGHVDAMLELLGVSSLGYAVNLALREGDVDYPERGRRYSLDRLDEDESRFTRHLLTGKTKREAASYLRLSVGETQLMLRRLARQVMGRMNVPFDELLIVLYLASVPAEDDDGSS